MTTDELKGQLAFTDEALRASAGVEEQRRTIGHRDGETYEARFDYERLNKQSRRVYNCMRDGMWRKLSDIAQATGDPEASISARLRDFRKRRFGGLIVERRRAQGTWFYRLLIAEED